MKRTRTAVACVALLSGCAGTVRYSQNPIGKAQFVGVAVCDELAKVQRMSGLRELAPYPVYVRTDFRPLRARGASGLSPAVGRTWTSALHESMGLTERDEPFVVLVTDRRGRIRGFSSALGGASQPEADPAAELDGLVEDLLLNIDGAEVITRHRPGGRRAAAADGARAAAGPDDADLAFQTDLERLEAEEARHGPARGALRPRFMRLLGKPLPDWTVRDAAGRKGSLRALAAGKVTVLAIFLAEEDAPADLRRAFAELREAWRDFGEGLARPGPRWVANARPDAP